MTGQPPSSQEKKADLDFRALFQRECGYVWNSLHRLGVRPADLEDTVHEVFLTFHRLLDRYDRSRPVRPWLFAIAVRIASDYRRKAYNRLEVIDSHIEMDGGSQPDTEAERNQARALVHTALQHLEPDRRAVFIMHDIDGVAMPEIAAALEIPLNTGYSRLRLARRDFSVIVKELRGSDGGAHERG